MASIKYISSQAEIQTVIKALGVNLTLKEDSSIT